MTTTGPEEYKPPWTLTPFARAKIEAMRLERLRAKAPEIDAPEIASPFAPSKSKAAEGRFRVLRAIQNAPGINTQELRDTLSLDNIGARVCELRKEGHNIRTICKRDSRACYKWEGKVETDEAIATVSVKMYADGRIEVIPHKTSPKYGTAQTLANQIEAYLETP